MAAPSVHNLALIGQQPGQKGRALQYDPEFCFRIRDMAQKGMFPEEWCGPIGVTLETMRVWGLTYPEFRDALIIARHVLAAYWSAEARLSIRGPMVNQGILTKILTSRFPEFYGKNPADIWHFLHSPDGSWRPEVAAQGGDGVAGLSRNLSEDEINARLAVLRARKEEAEK
jgi:hypothetical protein